MVDDLRRDARSLGLVLRRSPAQGRLLIAVDQLEELFTLCREEADRAAFVANLAGASALDERPARSPPEGDRATVVVTLRADFYAFLAPYPLIRDAAASSQAYVGAMSSDELRRAIEEPARRADWEFVPGLVDLLLRDVGDEPGALPLLSHAMLETWRRRRGVTMTLRSYAESGGVNGAIARTADRVYGHDLSDEQRAIARNTFVRLTELGEGTQDTRRRVRLAELLPSDPTAADAMRVVVGALADARLITVSEESVEVAHEALIREWPTLREWLRTDREGLRLYRRVTEATREWELSGFDDAILFRGGRLAQARDWAAANGGVLNDLEQRFLETSVAIAEREEAEREAGRQRELRVAEALAASESRRAEDAARSAARLRRRAVLLGAALVVAGVLAGVAVILAQQSSRGEANARANATLADQRAAEAHVSSLTSESERLGAEANTILLRGEDAELAALLALQGLHARYTPQADAALQRAANLYYGEQLFDPGKIRQQTPVGRATPERWGMTSAVVTPDGMTLITASNAAILFWDLATGKLTANIPTVATDLSLSRDGTVLLASRGGVYRLPDRAPLTSDCTFDDRIVEDGNPTFRAISPDGKTTATALVNGGIILEPVDACKGHRSRIEARVFSDPKVLDDPFPDEGSRLVFSPDGRRLAGVTGAAITVWDVASGRAVASFGSQLGDFRSLAFSPDGRRIVTANGDATARLFDAATGRLLETLTGHRNALTDARFSPDGRRVVTGSLDLTARLWDVATDRELQRYAGHTWAVLAVAFSPDGRSVFTASADGTARRWLTEPPLNTYQAGAGDVSALAFSGDSRLLASGTGNRIEVRDVPDETLLLGFEHQRNAHVALSPDARSMLIASDAGSSLWDVQTGHELHSFGSRSQPSRCDVAAYPDAGARERVVEIGAAAFLPKGDQVLANSPDCGLGLWDPASGPNLRTFSEGSPIAAVSADGSTVAYERFSACTEALVVDLQTGRTHVRSTDSCLIDLALAPDGKRLVLTDQGSFVVHVVDVATGRQIELRGHTAFVKEVRVSADGRFVLTAAGGADGTARLWDIATGKLLRVFPGHADLPVAGVAISPDDRLVAIGGSDGTVMVASLRLEDLEATVCSQLLRDLTADERTLYGVQDTSATCP